MTKALSYTYPVIQNYIYHGAHARNATLKQYVPKGCVLVGQLELIECRLAAFFGR